MRDLPLMIIEGVNLLYTKFKVGKWLHRLGYHEWYAVQDCLWCRWCPKTRAYSYEDYGF